MPSRWVRLNEIQLKFESFEWHNGPSSELREILGNVESLIGERRSRRQNVEGEVVREERLAHH